MEKDENKLVNRYEKFTGSALEVQKTLGATGTTLIKSDTEEPKDIDKYR